MPASQKLIQQKIDTAGSIKKTTRTMEMISAVKMRRSTKATLGVRRYARFALELLESMSEHRALKHILLEKRETGRVLLIIIGSQKGLCGGYNVALSKKLRESLQTGRLEAASVDVVAIGRQAERIAHRAKLAIKASFAGFNEVVSPDEVRHVLDLCIAEFAGSKIYRSVKLLHTAFVKPLEYQPIIRRLLPVSRRMAHEIAHGAEYGPRPALQANLYQFEPSTEAVLSQVLPQLLLATFFESALESLASEHSSRMVAMKNATDNAAAAQLALRLVFNKARQAGITAEIAEISGGAEALAGASLSV